MFGSIFALVASAAVVLSQVARLIGPPGGRNGMRDAGLLSSTETLSADELKQEVIARLGQRALVGTDLSTIFQETAVSVAEALGVEMVEVLELLPQENHLLLRAGVGWKRDLVGRATVGTENNSQAGYTLLQDAPIHVEDLRAETRFRGSALLLEHGVVSGMTVVIPGPSRPFGVLGAHTTVRRRFSRSDAHFLQAMANSLGAAVERQIREDELRQSEERYRGLYQAVSGGVVVQDRDGVIVDANDTACELLGLSLEEMRGRSSGDPRWRSVLENGDPFPAQQHPAMVSLATGKPVRHVVMGVYHPGKGEHRWLLVNSQPVLDQAAGKTVAAVTTFLDITDQKRQEEAQRFIASAGKGFSSSLEYETVLSTVAELAVPRMADWCAVDIRTEDGNVRRLALTHSDPAKVERAAELSRRCGPVLGSVHPISEVLRTGEARLYTELPTSLLEAAAKDPEVRRIIEEARLKSLMIVPLVARGRTIGAISFLSTESGRRYGPRDLALAEKLACQAALAADNARLYQEAQQAIGLRDEFLSMAAHELRTPITSLWGFAQLAIHQMDDGVVDPMRLRQSLQLIDDQSRKLTHLVFQMLEISRLQAGRLRLELQSVNVSELVERVMNGIGMAATNHQLLLNAPTPVWVTADLLRLEQVVTNLVDNAIRYSPDGGPVQVDVVAPDSGGARISVRDWGVGIPPEHRDGIFGRFYQAHQGANLSGLGLGLYISHQIVGLHGGKIEFDAPPDGGTRFVVTLPPRPAEARDFRDEAA